jgi:Tol biopolymer transport system component
LISAIMSFEPRRLSELQKDSPPSLDRTVAKCLAKDPEERWQTARDLVDELRWIDSGGAVETTVVAEPKTRRLAYGAVLGALLATATMWVVRPDSPSTPSPARLHLSFPETQELASGWNPPFVFSPDGSLLVYTARQPGSPRQFQLRPINGFEARPLPGTESAEMPFFSPDGGWIGFFSRGKLWKLSLAGGAPAAICDVSQFIVGASWGADDSIVFAVVGSGLMKVSAAGGSPEPLTTLREGEEHWWPQILPNGNAVVFTADTTSGFRPAIVSLETGEHRVLENLGAGRLARYVPTGHILFAEGGQLLAVPFDSMRLQVTGTATSVLDGLHTSPISGLASFAVSSKGALAYLRGGESEVERQLVLVDRNGNGTPIVDERGNFMSPSYSPDGTRVAVERFEGSGRRTIWVFDLISGARIRLTTGGENGMPVWGPSGDHITFWNEYETIQSKVAGGDAAVELHRSSHPVFPGSWTPAGEDLVFFEFHPETRGDIWVLPDAGEVKPWMVTEFSEGFPRLSPDGHWLAYVSNESGRYEVYVQPFPEAGEKIAVSTDGGYEPRWSPGGRELFYRIGARVMAVSMQTSPVFRSSRPRELFEGPYVSGATIAAVATTYDVAPDGEHFLMIEGGEEKGANQLHLVLNWFEELERLVPPD